MSEIENGGPAFPCQETFLPSGQIVRGTGLSMRDYFAAKAMTGMLAATDRPISIDPHIYAREAGVAYAIADAMLKARQK